MSRRTARESAMMLLFAWALGGAEENPLDEAETMSELIMPLLEGALDKDDEKYIHRVVEGVLEHQGQIDAEIEKYAVGWSLARMAKVDLSILRLAVFELLFEVKIPGGVSVNEAVELTHRFSTPEAGPFINGILGNINRAIDKP